MFCSVSSTVYIYASVGEMMGKLGMSSMSSHAGSSGIAMSSPNHGGYKEIIIFTRLFSAHNQSNCNSTTCSVKYAANYRYSRNVWQVVTWVNLLQQFCDYDEANTLLVKLDWSIWQIKMLPICQIHQTFLLYSCHCCGLILKTLRTFEMLARGLVTAESMTMTSHHALSTS